MKLIDTNVFMYANGTHHDLRDPCRLVLAQCLSGEIEANVDVEVLQEILHRYHALGATTKGRDLMRDIMISYSAPIPVLPTDMALAGDILVRYPALQSRDAVHAAVVFQHRLEGIISADRGFDIIDGLTRFDPRELAA